MQVALIPTAPIAVQAALATHGLARVHALLAHAALANRLSLPGRARADLWQGDAHALRTAAASAVAAEAFTCDPTVSARAAWPLPAPIAQASSMGSPQGWMAPLAAALGAHHWRSEDDEEDDDASPVIVETRGIAPGTRRKAPASGAAPKAKRARAPLLREIPLRVVWPSLRQVLNSVEGIQVRMCSHPSTFHR